MAFPGELVAFLASTDLDVSSMFYVDTLGLAVTERTPFALVVDGGGGTELRITLVQSKVDTGYTVLGWRTKDLSAAVDDLRGKGVEFLRYQGMDQDEYAAWTAPDGTRVAWFHDPHGNVLSLHQPPS
ncbi:catechol 2,3-dioxygenase-like lactoylglutathione lyase family enzyme [Rhodococcus sp. LBL1]|jgi:catechol 2,3-dioxygenase-like lactoylglutathione lyase family enzyme|uniref:Catechol 2,3-dioxygenase-like lactoylglutathione lyase family enzyme n=1 Tax=Prescottella agglutinans TaxID=1644129 RepID=A0ABT6M8I3_9NOCA|nr:VOC family protein [Prescottella agglutinans]MDH6280618.1 catechol 2,3-dioxygenase-like lactoylglutathione lyase family enzyme [Prescottella agglutinans]MDH6677443.1 catechol 2,3-dioxygenase-like lactoylglutathione lyase family enzyme [Rhodococcus sp. LBL1]MDH6682263.1 catechol 2,3-dioxygenase-like lactoylglutathione lyase family enzyme [Rhodococcus sp. LBL2]